jgi:two-component system KDP operon response regulator KdpE
MSQPSAARILVIDDEPQIHRFLRPALEAAGYSVERADTGAEGLRLAASRAPDAVLLDLGLPDLDGHDLLGRLRGFSDVPVIVLSARDRESDKISALDAGADDYVEKPFGVGELMARIRTALRHRRTQDHVPETVRFDGLEVDLAQRQAHAAGALLALSRREWALLSVLAHNAGRVLTHRQMLTAVWGPAHVEDVQYLRVYVGQLRQKLGEAGRLIGTEPGVGYRMAEAMPAVTAPSAGDTAEAAAVPEA